MERFPNAISDLIVHFSHLPGIGKKTAERFVFFLLEKDPNFLNKFGSDLSGLSNRVTKCKLCRNYTEKNPCLICQNPARDKKTICVLATSQNYLTIENTDEYRGLYHILGGTLNPIEGITPDQLSVKELIWRVQNTEVQEIILAFNSDMPGESTVLYLTKVLNQIKKDTPINVTRLAKGLPMGSDLDYADVITLQNALEGRKNVY